MCRFRFKYSCLCLEIVPGSGQAPRHKEGESKGQTCTIGREYGLAGKERNRVTAKGGATHPRNMIMTYGKQAGIPVLRRDKVPLFVYN